MTALSLEHHDCEPDCIPLIIRKTSLKSMSASTMAAVTSAALVGSLLAACGQQGPVDASKMLIKTVGPAKIEAGKKFNVQSDGSSAIWLVSQGIPKTAVPVLAGVELRGVNVRDNGTLVTALVPDKLTAAAGSYPIFMLDKPSGKKSNEIQLVVK